MITDSTLDMILSKIESHEIRSLQWGYVHGSFSDDDVLRIISNEEPTLDAAVILNDLIDRRLLYEFFDRVTGKQRYRSRFAELVRLLRLLKQLLPKKAWLSAPNLVSDFRVAARQRRAPRRDIPLPSVCDQLQLAGFPRQVTKDLLADRKISAFQLRASQALRAKPMASHGVVVSAGTGSGKTLAFYLPALIEISTLVRPDEYWLKALAIYPRIELLNDQCTAAFQEARKLDTLLKKAQRRPITIGTYFSKTPYTASVKDLDQAQWQQIGNDYICPFLKCPQCKGELLWRKAELDAGKEQLTCSKCREIIGEQYLVLTRQKAMKQPPDILFTTAEMLNRRISDSRSQKIFGIHPEASRCARLLLLDEIHTYTGMMGAQAAMVIRRWRHAVGSPVRCVGLSATLRDASEFFAQLTGLPQIAIVEVKPEESELERISMEYTVLLRGDAVSQTSLLSTSIQAAFLIRRMLDPTPQHQTSLSHGRFGQKLFVFTDDLDVINRFFDDLRDAEGYDLFGRPIHGHTPLAALRSPDAQQEGPLRDIHGQSWAFSQVQLNHSLSNRLRIGRTSSQDAGVATNSDIIVATASLEVGFDDPSVGAILQHKAPYSMATYLQRKGRAGRQIEMRPIMVMVLSDYGRDRLAFEAYEQFFDPFLKSQALPIQNQYILRIHAVLAFMDWLAHYHPLQWGNIWKMFSGPLDPRDPYLGNKQRERNEIRTIIQRILNNVVDEHGRNVRDLFTNHLEDALQINHMTAQSLLWESPRSLLLEVLPTIDRRFVTDWKIGTTKEHDLIASYPLPEFISQNLFSDLNLPEVTLVVPPATVNHTERNEMMPVIQALSQFAPGRVNRRFAYERGELSHWIPVDYMSTTYELPLTAFVTQSEYIADVTILRDGIPKIIPCYRPWKLELQKVPSSIATTSNAQLHWEYTIDTLDHGIGLVSPQYGLWSKTLVGITCFLHSQRTPLVVHRFTLCSEATIREVNTSEDHRVTSTFVKDGQQVALGSVQEVDGLQLRFAIPDGALLAERANQSASLPAWRVAYFRDCLHADETLFAMTNIFQRNWFAEIYLAALAVEACKSNLSLQNAQRELHDRDILNTCHQVMANIFQGELNEDGSLNTEETGRLAQTLTDLLSDERVMERLQVVAQEIWLPTAMRWQMWLRQRVQATFGEAALLACTYIIPQHINADALRVDLGPLGEEDPHAVIWISEDVLGGVGLVNAIANALGDDSQLLAKKLEAALAPSLLELAVLNMDRTIVATQHASAVASALATVRHEYAYEQHEHAQQQLYHELARHGVTVDHTFSVMLNERLLRAQMDATSDTLFQEILNFWHATEERLGVALNLRVFAHLVTTHATFGTRLRALIEAQTEADVDDAQLLGATMSVLWPRAPQTREYAYQSYSPYHPRSWTDAALISELVLVYQPPLVQFDDVGWREALIFALEKEGTVRVATHSDQEQALRMFLAEIIATPIDVDFLQWYPSIQRIDAREDGMIVTLILQEEQV